MYTLKVNWTRHRAENRHSPPHLDDEMTYFVAADEVTVHSVVSGATWQEDFKHWSPDDYDPSLSVTFYDEAVTDVDQQVHYEDGRLIRVDRNGEPRWILTSRAWLLGPDGRTIERIA